MNNTIAHALLTAKAISLSPDNPFQFSSGLRSPIYCDNRVLISHLIERQIIIDALIDKVKHLSINFDLIAGTATAGIPWAAWLSDRLNLPMVYVRGKPKAHGKTNQIEGYFTKGQKALVIEDLISTGQSALSCAKALRDQGLDASHCLSIFTYSFISTQTQMKQHAIQSESLCNLQDILTTALRENMINSEQHKYIINWQKEAATS